MTKSREKNVDESILAERNSAYECRKHGHYESAEIHYLKAWELFPEPKYDWDSSQITIYRISDFYLEWKKFDRALNWAELVFKTNPLPGDGTPYIMVGKIYFESGNKELALQKFQKAFSLAGKRAFDGEDKKYYEYSKKNS